MSVSALLKSRIRTVRDWPKPGVNFRDATTLFHDPGAFRATIDAFAEDCAKQQIDIIAAVDARGFILGGALAYKLGKPFALVRKRESCLTRPCRRTIISSTARRRWRSMRTRARRVIAF
ncbi:MAG: hypothetical protein QM760_05280 [Nibricoccus sp.]